MRWVNGGGWTSEIVVVPLVEQPPGNPESGQFAWRLSVADVETPGPFSTFKDADRTIALLRGNGFSLTHGQLSGVPMDVPFVPYEFDGALNTHCELIDGPVQDLNLMVHRSSAQMSLSFAWLTAGQPLRLDGIAALVVVDGFVPLGGYRLGYLDAVIAPGTGRDLTIESLSDAAVVAVVSCCR